MDKLTDRLINEWIREKIVVTQNLADTVLFHAVFMNLKHYIKHRSDVSVDVKFNVSNENIDVALNVKNSGDYRITEMQLLNILFSRGCAIRHENRETVCAKMILYDDDGMRY